jgi:hypothetical protein
MHKNLVQDSAFFLCKALHFYFAIHSLRQWWNEYQEANRKKLEDEIKKSLKNLSIKELKEINDKIKSRE